MISTERLFARTVQVGATDSNNIAHDKWFWNTSKAVISVTAVNKGEQVNETN